MGSGVWGPTSHLAHSRSVHYSQDRAWARAAVGPCGCYMHTPGGGRKCVGHKGGLFFLGGGIRGGGPVCIRMLSKLWCPSPPSGFSLVSECLIKGDLLD